MIQVYITLPFFNGNPTSSISTAQFEIAYGNKSGGGAYAFNSLVSNISPSSTIYGQYRTLVLEDENADFCIWRCNR